MNPKTLTFRMPAEWEQHTRTFISWPMRDSMVYPDQYEHVCKGYEEVIRAVAEFEPVSVIVDPDDIDQVSRIFQNERIECIPIAHNDAWIRDNGPTFLLNDHKELAGVNWRFNAWGGKYSPWDLDDAVAHKLLEHIGIQQFDAPLVLEGGSIHTDGEGTLLTTEECLLNPNRNPDLGREQIEECLSNYLNVDKIIWLKRGLSGDETDGHIDNIACFAAPGKVILQVCDDPSDENYEITQECLEILHGTVDAQGRKLEVISIQQPPKRMYGEDRLTLSYLNFYFVNGGIILPVFGGDAKETDEQAVKVLSETFPDRKVRTIDGMGIIAEGGNVHCITQQMPKAGN